MITPLEPDAPTKTGRANWLLFILIGVFGLARLPSLSAQSSPATLPDLQFSRGGRVSAIGIQDDGRIDQWLLSGGQWGGKNEYRPNQSQWLCRRYLESKRS